MYFEWSGLEPARRHTPHIGHGQHLCDMAQKGVVSLEQMKVLVKNAKFICRKCGRVAARDVNLCEPVAL